MAHFPHTDVTRETCLRADQADPLRKYRDQFALPDDVIYLDGNSLGARPKAAAARAADVVEREWGTDLIASWNTNQWFNLPVRIGTKVGQLIGGSGGQCVVTDTTSVNVFKALAAALRLQESDRPGRRVILSERENFPTDLYMIEGLISFLGDVDGRSYELRLIDDVRELRETLVASGDEVAAVLLTHVNYRSGAMWAMNEVTAAVHEAGALMIWDLCHSAGAVPVDLDAAGADFAVGCTYKYLNGGPGSPAFIWAAARHLPRIEQPLSGWWGHAKPFEMSVSFDPAEGAKRLLVGTQPIISLATAEIGIDLALSVDQAAYREKSLGLTTLFIDLVESRLASHPLTLVTPRDEASRGSHVSFRHPEGYAVMKALIADGVIGDYREPEILRFGFAPLYNSFTDVWDAVEALRLVLDEERWRAPGFQHRDAVT